jgi:CRP/FNR family transcriptional regulator
MIKVRCTECPLRQFRIFDTFTHEEVEFMHSFKSGELHVHPGTTVLMEGMPSPQLFTILKGLGVRYRNLADGERQVINFALPGDLIGLQAALLGEMSHSFESTTSMTLCVFDRSDLWRLFQRHPERAFDLTWLSAIEEHFLGEALSTLGRRNALERIAWALLRVYDRLRAVGLERDGGVPMPWRQRDLADALGLSLVHTNKTLQKLRHTGLATWMDTTLKIPDPAGLARIANVDLVAPQRRPLI